MRELTPEDIEQRGQRVEILEALDAAMGQGIRFMELGQAAESVEDFTSAIENWLGCSHLAARAVMELQMRRMPRAERQKITDELQQLRRELAEASGT
jgi:DNA gyrase/topoisomerase IV subunit A